jgi:hypothetical protein
MKKDVRKHDEGARDSWFVHGLFPICPINRETDIQPLEGCWAGCRSLLIELTMYGKSYAWMM